MLDDVLLCCAIRTGTSRSGSGSGWMARSEKDAGVSVPSLKRLAGADLKRRQLVVPRRRVLSVPTIAERLYAEWADSGGRQSTLQAPSLVDRWRVTRSVASGASKPRWVFDSELGGFTSIRSHGGRRTDTGSQGRDLLPGHHQSACHVLDDVDVTERLALAPDSTLYGYKPSSYGVFALRDSNED